MTDWKFMTVHIVKSRLRFVRILMVGASAIVADYAPSISPPLEGWGLWSFQDQPGRPSAKIAYQFAAAARVAQFGQCLFFNLTYPLLGEGQLCAHFAQSPTALVPQSIP